MKYRDRVLGLIVLLLIVTYLDRVCMSVAGPRVQQEFGLSPVQWGWVTGVFTIAYALFEIPTGSLADRIGPKTVLNRIVLWWSAFTAATGAVTGFYPLLATRFLFGAGEAGAYPVASVTVGRWFPAVERGRAFGILLMSGQIGGALTPLLVVPLQMKFGWRVSFYAFSLLGVLWCLAWRWFRDSPREMPGIPAQELEALKDVTQPARHSAPLRIYGSGNLWAVMLIVFCYANTFYFFQTWFHTYLVRKHGYSEKDLLLSSIPFAVGALSNFLGGLAASAAVKKMGLKRGRRFIGLAAMSVAAVGMVIVPVTTNGLAVLLLLTISYAGVTFQQPNVFAAMADIGGEFTGAVTGAMNTAAQVSSFASSVLFGYLVEHYGNYDTPFIPMAALLVIGIGLWLKFDASRPIAA